MKKTIGITLALLLIGAITTTTIAVGVTFTLPDRNDLVIPYYPVLTVPDKNQLSIPYDPSYKEIHWPPVNGVKWPWPPPQVVKLPPIQIINWTSPIMEPVQPIVIRPMPILGGSVQQSFVGDPIRFSFVSGPIKNPVVGKPIETPIVVPLEVN